MRYNTYSEKECTVLHDEIQKRFHAWVAQIQATVPSLDARFGKTVTKIFPLFSYVSFKPTQADEGEEIVVGIDIGPHDGQWRIDADVSEDESGTIFFEVPNSPFSASSFQDLTDHALRAVEQLTTGAKPVLIRLLGLSTPALPSQNATVSDLANKT